jgi:hypothetical protein
MQVGCKSDICRFRDGLANSLFGIPNRMTDCYCAASSPREDGMIKARRAIVVTLFAVSICWPLSSPHAEQAFLRFTPLLIELDGWQGKKADGLSMEMASASMTTATRDYRRGSAQVHAGVIVGPAAVGALAPLQTGVNIETADGHMMTSTMQGLSVMKSFNIQQKSGAIIVALAKDAVFSFSYNGIAEDEAMALAQRFDWKAMQSAAQTK